MFVFVIVTGTAQVILNKVKSLIKDEVRSGAEREYAQFPRENVNLTYRMKVHSLQLPKS